MQWLLDLLRNLFHRPAAGEVSPDGSVALDAHANGSPASAAQQRHAFLQMLQKCEGTFGPNAYTTGFGGRQFVIGKDHPRLKVYEKFPGQFGVPLKSGGLNYTTACGAYQITATTWDTEIQPALHLPDFGDPSQDRAALFLIEKEGALEDVDLGRLQVAIDKCGGRWASLPSSKVSQPRKTYQFAAQAFTAAGGVIAN